VLEHFNLAFERDYGLDLRQLAQRHDQVAAVRERIETLYVQLTQVAVEAAADRARVQYLEPELAGARANIDRLTHQLQIAQAHIATLENQFARRIEEVLAETHRWQQQYRDIVVSTSWRVTAPLRGLKEATGLLGPSLVRAVRRTLGWMALILLKPALRVSAIRTAASRCVRRFPRLHAHVVAFARARRLIPAEAPASVAGSAMPGPAPSAVAAPGAGRSLVAGINRDQMSPLESTFTSDERP
jgi:hypothetical protein